MENKIQVLLVDDERDFLEPISFWLKSKGYSVILANNGRQAIKLVKSDHPDIVFLDINMPVMDGIEALARIRKFNKEIPIILLTAHGDSKVTAVVNQLGISGFFPKKANLTQLTDILETTLRIHKKLRPSSTPSSQKKEKDKRDNRKEEE
ncbi:MAG: response regulator [Candidatus Omnitrophica bacterium]|nr:response regulator [Candidatus Omnitrophota bacterium]